LTLFLSFGKFHTARFITVVIAQYRRDKWQNYHQ
jgi:hypothetical protein